MLHKISLSDGGKVINTSETYSTDIHGADISSLILDNDRTNTLGNSAMLARSGVPELHRRLADNYMIIKKVFGFPAVQCRISNEEKNLLARYDFNTLEFSTIKQINEELAFLKRWSESRDPELRNAADKIIEIRAKELKYLVAINYVSVSNEIYMGYKALERYFEVISKYYE